MISNLGLVSDSATISTSELTRVAAALQKQVTRDFTPFWQVNATVSAFAKLEDLPVGYWPIIVQDDIHQEGAAGIHLDDHGQPYALVTSGSDWSLTASHETLEMLADPSGNRLIAGQSPKKAQGRVEFLTEVCDPSEAADFAYTVNGVLVSDFYTPHYFDPSKTTGARYSFSGAISAPRQILRGGYLSWHVPTTDHWWQAQFFGPKITYHNLGVFGRLDGSLRSMIDRRTITPRMTAALQEKPQPLKSEALTECHSATAARAIALRQQIERMKKACVSHE